MKRLQRLCSEARESCHLRGHRMKRFRNVNQSGGEVHRGTRPIYQSECLDCGDWVQVDPNPYPNGIEIGGTAVALPCK